MSEQLPADDPQDSVAPSGPLNGRTIVVTRSRQQASQLSQRLTQLGAQVLEIPTIAIAAPRSFTALDEALRSLREYDWLIVTSPNGARVIGERIAELALHVVFQPRTVAIGPATAQALKTAGLRVDLLPPSAVAESLLSALAAEVNGQKLLLVRAEVARDLLPTALQEAGAQVTIVDAYRTVLAKDSVALVRDAFHEGARSPDALTFTSSSTVTNFFALLEEAGCPLPPLAPAYSIGPVTSRTLREHGVEPTLEAARHDVSGLVEALLQGLGGY